MNKTSRSGRISATRSLKHAGVQEAQVSLSKEAGAVSLEVSDRGRGMPATPGGSSGLGLINIKERARLVKGSLEIAGRPNEGTSVKLTVPAELARASSAPGGG